MILRVALLLVLGLAIACGSRDDDRVRLTIWEQMEPAEQALLREHVAQFEAEHPGVEVSTLHFETENLRSQFQTAGLARTGPDLVYGPSDQVGPFSIMGLVEPLERLVPADTLALYVDSAKPSLEGHVYALADQVGNHLTLVYNKAFVDRPPTTSDEWLAMARENTVDENGDGRIDRYGIVMNLTEPFWLVPWLGAYGGWVMDEFAEPTLDSAAMVQALAFLRDMVVQGVAPPGCDYPLADTLFKEGSAAFTVNGPWSWQTYEEAGIDVGLALIPPVAGGDYPTPMTSCKAYSVSVHVPEERRELVMELLYHLTSASTVGNVSTSLGALPSRTDVGSWESVISNPMLQSSWQQLRQGQLMPVVPEMRAIWDVMRPAFQQTLSGSMTPEDAAEQMQRQAVRKIEEMRL